MTLKRIMNCRFLLLLLCCATQQMKSQEKWDEYNARYTNNTYHFHWYLPDDLVWIKQISQEKHTLFRAESPLGLTVFVNASAIEESDYPDMWDDYDFYKESYEQALAYSKTIADNDVTLLQMDKVKFAGTRALKLVERVRVVDDVKNRTFYGITYRFIMYGYSWYVSLKCEKVLYDELGVNGLSGVFAGFGMNAKTD